MNTVEPSPGLPEGATLAVLQAYSFTHEAALFLQRQRPDLQIQTCDDIHRMLDEVKKRSALAVMPLENSSSGPVDRHLQLLLDDPDLSLVADIPWQVGVHMGAIRGATALRVRAVCSHPQALKQSNIYLDELDRQRHAAKLSSLERIETPSTSDAVRSLKRHPDRLALASRLAFEELGPELELDLSIMECDVSNLKGWANQTHMAVVKTNGHEPLPLTRERYHTYDMALRDSPGILYQVLDTVALADIDLTSLHSRPAKKEDEYRFFIEMDARNSSPDKLQLMHNAISGLDAVRDLRCLGSHSLRYSPMNAVPEPSAVERHIELPDVSHTEFTLQIMPRNVPGILAHILGILKAGGGNLTKLNSSTTGPKEYMFTMNLTRTSTPENFALAARVLGDDPNIVSMRWESKA